MYCQMANPRGSDQHARLTKELTKAPRCPTSWSIYTALHFWVFVNHMAMLWCFMVLSHCMKQSMNLLPQASYSRRFCNTYLQRQLILGNFQRICFLHEKSLHSECSVPFSYLISKRMKIVHTPSTNIYKY